MKGKKKGYKHSHIYRHVSVEEKLHIHGSSSSSERERERENEVNEERNSSYRSFICHVCVGFIHVWMVFHPP